MACIYILTNKINSKKYVGQTVRTFQERLNNHISVSKRKPKHLIDRAINKYGIKNFDTYFYECSIEDLDYLEVETIKTLDSIKHDNGYNLESGGNKEKSIQKRLRRK